MDSPDNFTIMSFDVRHASFNMIKVPSRVIPTGYENMWVARHYTTDKTLINYGGKVGVVENPSDHGRCFRLLGCGRC